MKVMVFGEVRTMCNDVTWKACLEQGHSFKYLACVLNKNGTDDANQNISYAR